MRPTKLKQGDYVVTADYRRGFIMWPTSTGSYNVMFRSDNGLWAKESWPASLLDLSGIEPSEEECVDWTKWMLG